MLSTLRNAWKVPDLKKRILWTIFLVAIFRMGSYIPVPGINTDTLGQMAQSNGLLSFYDLIAGGSFSRFSVFALGVTPYINASIIMSLLTIAIPRLEQISKEGEEGRKKIKKVERYLAIVFAIILAFGTIALGQSYNMLIDSSVTGIYVVLLTLVVGTMFCIWLGDQLTVKGIGNGISMIIFVNIISGIPSTIAQVSTIKNVTFIDIGLFVVGILAMIFGVVYLSLAERRITVQYAGKAVGNKVYKGQQAHIPISIIGTAVIAIIFAMSVMQFPIIIATIFKDHDWAIWLMDGTFSPFNQKGWVYPIVYALLTVFFTWFYTQVTFKPDEMAENMHKSAGFIPGIRPGKPTEDYLEKVLDRISVFGGVFAAIIAVTPIIVSNHTSFENVQFGGTTLLIMVSVSLEVIRQLKSQLVMRHYTGFLK